MSTPRKQPPPPEKRSRAQGLPLFRPDQRVRRSIPSRRTGPLSFPLRPAFGMKSPTWKRVPAPFSPAAGPAPDPRCRTPAYNPHSFLRALEIPPFFSLNSSCGARARTRVLSSTKATRRAQSRRCAGAPSRPRTFSMALPDLEVVSRPGPHHGDPRRTGFTDAFPRHPAAYLRRFLQPLTADIKQRDCPVPRRPEYGCAPRKNSSATSQPPFRIPPLRRRAIFSSDTTAHTPETPHPPFFP